MPLVAALLGSWGCAAEAPPPPPETPRLVVLVVVDQARYDYLERLRPLFTGGLARLLDAGVSFTEAHHAHAVTNTAPGHATLVTGRHPAAHGIVSNYWWDHRRGDWVYSVFDPERRRVSPLNLRCDSLGEWIVRRYPRARVFAVGGKDRSAVLLGGRGAEGAFWFDDESGDMVTSRHYYRRPPAWLAELNRRGGADDYLGRPWEALPVAAEAAAAAGFEAADGGDFQRGFPHPLGGLDPVPEESFWGAVYRSPYLDELVARLAETLIAAEGLGDDEQPDLLGLAFSSLDTVGHGYGPDSPEVLDVLLRLDRLLGRLFDRLDDRIGGDRVLVALSSDHGVAPLPEMQQRRGLPGRRAAAADVACLQRAGLELERRFGSADWLGDGLVIDGAALARAGIDREQAEVAAAELIAACPLVERVWRRSRLLAGEEDADDPRAAAFRRSVHPQRGPDLLLELPAYVVPQLDGRTGHGSPQRYDTHVPLLIAGPGVVAGRVDEPVWTVDLAPTLAELLAVPVPADVDGRSLAGWLTGGPAAVPER